MTDKQDCHNIQRHFVDVSNAKGASQLIHYRQYGELKSGELPVILLHPSPLSSAFMVPMLSLLGEGRCAIAWDTPGYGDSEPLLGEGRELADYCQSLLNFLDALHIDKAIIYGNATGAQIGIEFAKLVPQRVSRLVLENSAWFYDDERDAMLKRYFPDLTPTGDGEHLQQIWHIVSRLFTAFPWYDTSDAAKLNLPPMPNALLQQVALDYQKAGQHYADAYIAALHNEKPEQLALVGVPTTVLISPDSPIYRFSARLLEAELPQHIRCIEVNAGHQNRLNALTDIVN